VARNRIETGLLVEAAKEINLKLTESGTPHGVLGGVAAYLHGAERTHADDVDILLGIANEKKVRDMVETLGFQKSNKYYLRGEIKIQITTKSFTSFPNPENSNEWISINNIRVPTIERMIKTKAEACKDILEKVLSEGIDGTSRRNALIKHTTDLVDLVKAYAKNKRK
jgi:hypothetical protein